jgi:drug/metabolite transporter (DMT)-like permease
MATHAEGSSVLLLKKFGGLFLIVFGLLLMGTGYGGNYSGVTTLGVLLLIGGMILLALKIARRNRANTL